MKRYREILFIATISFLVIASSLSAQPTIPKEKIPVNTPTDVKRQIEKLFSSDPVDRGNAAYNLGKLGKKATAAIPFLIGILRDDSPLEWIIQIDSDKSFVDYLTDHFKKYPDVEPPKRTLGLRTETILNKLGIDDRKKLGIDRKNSNLVHFKMTIEGFEEKLTTPANEAAIALSKIAPTELLISASKDKKSDILVQKNLLYTLGEKRDPSAVNHLIAALKDENSDVCNTALEALVKIGNPAVKKLISALNSNDLGVKEEAIVALGMIGDIRAVDPLIDLLKDNDYGIRWQATKALGKIGDVRAVDPLITVLKDEDASVRENAVNVLIEIGKPSVEPLISSLKHEDISVRHLALEALGRIGDIRAVDPLFDSLKDNDTVVRQTATVALGRIGGERAEDHLISALKHEDAFVRKEAVKALSNAGGVRVVNPLITIFKDNDRIVRWQAVKEISEMSGDHVVEPLIASLKHKDFGVRRGAVEALGMIGDIRAVDPLITALKDEHWEVRFNAEKALQKIIGKDLGEDPIKWEKWWDQNKKSFIKKN